MGFRFNKEETISRYKELYKVHGYLSRDRWDEYVDYPGGSWIEKIWGTWRNFVSDCGFESDLRQPKQNVFCKNCNKEFKKTVAEIKNTKNNFCCQSCAAIYNNTHKTKGIRVSKLEVWLAKELPKLYPNLEFHFNRKDTINSELDIYIPSLKLAFELNGIFHYEPIFGKEKLKSIKNNDNRKFQACIENNIELCIIDSSSLGYFKLDKVKKYLDMIKHIIDLKLKSGQ